MTALNAAHVELDIQGLRALARQRGPCATLVVPSRHPGALEGSGCALVRSLIRSSCDQLTHGDTSPVAELLTPLEAIARESGVDSGGPGFVIFRSLEGAARYDLLDQPAERLIVSDRFYLLPFMADASAPQKLFLLGLGQKYLRLFRYESGSCEELPLPVTVPPNLSTALGHDQPDHDLTNRSSAGPSTGAMGGVQFGTQADREALPEHLHQFFGIVDRGLKATLGDKPLLPIGVQEDIAAYRRAAKYSQLLESEYVGSTESLTLTEIASCARQAARAHYASQAEHVLATFREMRDRNRTLADVPAIVRAAEEGRVHQLCVREDVASKTKGEDLANTAAVDTLSTGGDAYVLPGDKMPEPMVAILRY